MARSRKQMRYHLPALMEHGEDGVFIVSIPTRHGCSSCGRTVDKAMDNIAEAAALCLEEE